MSLLPSWLLKKTYERIGATSGTNGKRRLGSFDGARHAIARLVTSPASSFFREDWYRATYPDAERAVRRGEFPSYLEHYRQTARSLACSPSPLFDEAWYRRRHADVGHAVQIGEVSSGLDHYLTVGAKLGYVPCPFFDSQWYAKVNSDLADDPWSDPLTTPFSHFVLHGQSEGRRPSPLFDATWYERRYSACRSAIAGGRYQAPFEHYCAEGARERFDPGPYFFEEEYVKRHPDVGRMLRAGVHANGYAHYVQDGARAGLTGNPFFDDATYVAANPGIEQDPQYRLYPSALSHYGHIGARQGRPPNELFDAGFYLSAYPEARLPISEGGVDSPFAHFCRIGHALGRRPSPRFDELYYLQLHQDVAGAVARKAVHSGFAHYLMHGRTEGRSAHPFVPPEFIGARGPGTVRGNGKSSARFKSTSFHGLETLAGLDFHRIDEELAYATELVERYPDESSFRELLAYASLRALDVAGAARAVAGMRLDTLQRACLAATLNRLSSKKERAPEIAHTLEANLLDRLPFVEVEGVLPGRVHAGATLDFFLKGWLFHPCVRSWELSVVVGSRQHEVRGRDVRLDLNHRFAMVDPAGATAFAGFHESVLTELDAAFGPGSTVPIELHGRSTASVDGKERTFEVTLGDISVVGKPPRASRPPAIVQKARAAPIAICMAAFNPDPELLFRQIESIRKQTHRNWTLTISDESIDGERRDELRRITDGDPRITLLRAPVRRGFYFNFETALAGAPKAAAFVALADQDDYWYPEKLEALLAEASRPGVTLAFGDMRLVTPDGKVLADTFWTERENHFEDPVELLIANTVTGAASLFKAELLEKLLPFPVVGHLYHDQWIAMCAATAGRIAFIDRPLHDYVQHGSNVIGASGSNRATSTEWLRHLHERLHDPKNRGSAFNARLVAHCAHQWGEEPARLSHVLRILVQRLGGPDNTSIVNLLEKRLATYHESSARKTLGAEWRICAADAAVTQARAEPASMLAVAELDAVEETRFRVVRADAGAARALEVTSVDSADHLAVKIAPLRVRMDASARRRVNFLIPEIAYGTFFGGYIGKFQLALKLARSGYDVRMICVDRTGSNVAEWLRIESSFPGLRGFFDEVEVVRAFGRLDEIPFNPNDAVIASTWWSAHIASKLMAHLGNRRFLYLIQEYEPFTFPMGSWYAMAHESYALAHDALFSTALLARYFEGRRIGVYGPQGGNAAHFSNAIARFPAPRPRVASSPRRLAFYCRPEGHAARNMFEVGTAALRAAIAQGVFDGEDWQFRGMGTTADAVRLSPHHELAQVGKLTMDDYKEQLGRFDLGLSLMYTPHPSLVPLEMAAAGLLVVSNTCENKTADALREISDRFVPCAPTIEGVVDGLRAAVKRLRSDEPLRANAVNWPQSWDEALNAGVMSFVKKCFAT
ncbi:MAG TPA: glycosyltransferase [Polyangiaceae bacterium]|jgi:hypothetical protein|nr:glycosyltransferase [Polyangiaceae bacterium]